MRGLEKKEMPISLTYSSYNSIILVVPKPCKILTRMNVPPILQRLKLLLRYRSVHVHIREINMFKITKMSYIVNTYKSKLYI